MSSPSVQVYRAQPDSKTMPGSPGSSGCVDEVEGVTPFAALLGAVYYLPLLVLLTVAGLWLTALLW